MPVFSLARWQGVVTGYARLPTYHYNTSGDRALRRHCALGSRPLARLAVVALLAVFLAIFLRVSVYWWSGVPDYTAVWEYEASLPQHDETLFPLSDKFVKFNVPYAHLGWNNFLQDLIMVSHIALLADRINAFPPYVWSSNAFIPVVLDYDGMRLRSSVIPLNAFVAGPIAGGAWNATAISDAWWERVCPPKQRVVLDVWETRKVMGIESGEATGKETIDAWSNKLRNMEEQCVVVDGGHVFSFDDYGSPRLLSAWDSLSVSPILEQFQWSPLVESIVLQNLGPLLPTIDSATTRVPSTLPGLLSIHVRRGDYISHCNLLRDRGINYNAWNSFPDYPDQFKPPGLPLERHTSYATHCLPTVDQIIQRVHDVKAEWKSNTPLTRVYIMTDAEPAFRNAVVSGLKAAGWTSVVTSRDLHVPPEAVEVAVAADMLIGERAEVFLGNGFSSLTSNTNLLRRARGKPASSSRFW